MSEPQRGDATPSEPVGPAPLQASLESWRSAGAWRLDPVRFHSLEALARRLAGQPPPVRRLLQDKLQAGLADYAGRLAQAQQAAGEAAPRLSVRPPVPAPPETAGAPLSQLSQLNQYIRGAVPQPAELASVGRFRQAWSRGHAQDQVERAVARKPANAGPLNSHLLLLQSLELMRELSPDYLRRFLSQVESLQWLERARETYPPKQAKPVKATRRGKAKK